MKKKVDTQVSKIKNLEGEISKIRVQKVTFQRKFKDENDKHNKLKKAKADEILRLKKGALKKDKEIDKQNSELKDLELTLGNLEDSKKLAGRSTGLSDREAHAAEDDEYLQGLLTQYAVDGKKGLKVLTKDKAYLAAGKCVEKWRGLKGEDNQNYLKANFDETWNNYDVKGKNKIEESEAYQLLKEI